MAEPGAQARIRRTASICAGVAVGMTALAFASAPLYDLFCRVTGFAGTPLVAAQGAGRVAARRITVRFDSNVAPGLPWRFTPDIASLDVQLGETQTVFYTISNRSDTELTGVAAFNVLPDQAGAYFNKLQCFCFKDMTLAPGESVDVPVAFFIDPALADNRDFDATEQITLSYTFFRSKTAREPVAALKDPTGPKL